MDYQLKNGLDLMADYVYLSKYSQKKADGALETWEESIDRIYGMHEIKLAEKYGYGSDTFKTAMQMIERAKALENRKVILSSQRGRQFASTNPTSGILKHESKIYNCTGTFIDRMEVFGEIMYLLLSGCGVGYSLHKPYVERLPKIKKQTGKLATPFTVSDDIEGWGNCANYVIGSLYEGKNPAVDYSLIRPEGALIDGKFAAPGPAPLMKAMRLIEDIMIHAQGRQLSTIEVHDIVCHIADSVVCGGVRRSAMIALFDKDDKDMLSAKTGTWWTENPQRAMANNSILCTYDDPLTYEDYKRITAVVRQFGEPGFVMVPSYDYMVNPCAEIVMQPVYYDPWNLTGEGEATASTGFAFCNLVEINAERCKSVFEFTEACEVAAFVGTLQALYTDFKYIGATSMKIAERDRNIGVSITGIYANPLLRGEVLRAGAITVAGENARWAKEFGIASSRTCTTIKPSGNASSILGLSCSGIHPAHSSRYLRRIRILTTSPEYKALEGTPLVKKLRGNEAVISFPIEITDERVTLKDQVTAIEHLKFIAMVKHFWINKGCTQPKAVSHNISATVEVGDAEWNEVAAVLYVNQHLYTGVSLLPKLGDQIYDNAPFSRIITDEEKREFKAITRYLEENHVDFLSIMSEREAFHSGDMAATACAGGACEIK